MQTTLSSPQALSQSTGHSFTRSLPGRIVLMVAATVFIAICAHISVPLPFTPVPLSMQDFAVLLVGLALGPVAGFGALALYLAEGAMGMPVFTPQGLGGVAQIIGPTGGFLLSYPFVAAIAGWGARSLRIQNGFARAALACTFASIVLFAFGATWLAQYRHLAPLPVFHLAVTPFLPGNIVKIAAASGIFSAIDRLRRA